MSESNDGARALRVMVEALRAEEPRELAWDAIEQRIMSEVERRAQERASAPAYGAARAPVTGDARLARSRAGGGSSLGHVFGFAAAAACLIFGGLSLGSGEPYAASAPALRAVDAASAPVAPGEAGARGERDLLSLRPGDVIESGSAPLVFGRDGALSWTLAPGGRLVVRKVGAGGVGHTVALERGSIRAEVTPRDPAEGLVEAFAVEVENTRVAVHGTAFSVAREGDRVIVDVEHGSVAVGPRGHVGVTTGHLLIGPRRASFSLDGGRSARLLPRSDGGSPALAVAAVDRPAEVQRDPAARAAAPAPAQELRPAPPLHAAPKAASPEPPPPPAAAPPPPTLTPAGVRASLAQCFETTYGAGASSVPFSVSTTFRLVLKSDGSILSARFDPPLKPEFQACAGGSIAGRRFAQDGGALDIPITMKR